jgi:hypothetical protein
MTIVVSVGFFIMNMFIIFDILNKPNQVIGFDRILIMTCAALNFIQGVIFFSGVQECLK